MKTILYRILNELTEHHANKEDLLTQYIKERLDKSYAQYDKELQQTLQFLTYKHEKSLVKRLK